MCANLLREGQCGVSQRHQRLEVQSLPARADNFGGEFKQKGGTKDEEALGLHKSTEFYSKCGWNCT
jgi:hypothetical protein